EAFEEAFAQIDAAERWGLDVMWLAELHFDPQRSVLSAPLSIASAVAARTNRIKIGIAVQVLPLCHPLRIAEEGATVDQISGGRRARPADLYQCPLRIVFGIRPGDPQISRSLWCSGPPGPRASVSPGPGLSRRDRRAGTLGARGEPDAFLPRAGPAAPGFAEP